VRLLAGLLIAFAIAAGLGLWSVRFALDSPPTLGTVRSGPWSATPDKGSLDANPYHRAIVARGGEAPLPPSDAVVFTTIRDSEGKRLRGECDYRVDGEVPPSRFWTLSVYDPAGFQIATGGRTALSSSEMIHTSGAGTYVALSPAARPGNWLSTPASGPFTLVLRLYESTGAAQLRGSQETTLPAIHRGDCR
jgi:hypothetical protein